MILATFHQLTSGIYVGFSAKGHAGYSAEGEPDIICAAVTALCTGCISSLKDILFLDPMYQLEEGCITCELRAFPNEEIAHQAQLLFKSLRLSLQQIQISYGSKYLNVVDQSTTKEE